MDVIHLDLLHGSSKKKKKVGVEAKSMMDGSNEVLNVPSCTNTSRNTLGSSATSSSVPEEFMWGDCEEVDEDELVKAAIACSLNNQKNETEDIELLQLIEDFQKETIKPIETCTAVVLQKKLMQTCMRAV